MMAVRMRAMAATSKASDSLRRVVHSFFILPRATGAIDKFNQCKTLPFTTPRNSLGFGIRQLSQYAKSDADFLLKGTADKDTVEDVNRILDMAKRAATTRQILHSGFLTAPVLKEATQALKILVDIKMVAQGGYPKAERCRVSIGHSDVLTTDPDIIAALNISGNFGFQPCSHSDFLGAILGTGISREKLGDIILQGEKGAQVLVVPELVDYLTSSLDKVGNVSVTCKRIPLLAIESKPPRTYKTKSIDTVESSLRLDSIASAGCKISRTKMAALISNGDVCVNGNSKIKNKTNVKKGDIISVNGKRRLEVGQVNSTKNGKFEVELIRYL